ncbi:hypothetical protein EDD16DRAFT_1589484 [Pisolithus croceorrhizus]|nr:hypothetical protein EDD16DRAFT_1589484 [Pisolithus croceorrhizus]
MMSRGLWLPNRGPRDLRSLFVLLLLCDQLRTESVFVRHDRWELLYPETNDAPDMTLAGLKTIHDEYFSSVHPFPPITTMSMPGDAIVSYLVSARNRLPWYVPPWLFSRCQIPVEARRTGSCF